MALSSGTAQARLWELADALRMAISRVDELLPSLCRMDVATLLAFAEERRALNEQLEAARPLLDAAVNAPDCAKVVAEIRALSRALSERDRTFGQLAARSLEVLGALRRQLVPEGYDRRGRRVATQIAPSRGSL